MLAKLLSSFAVDSVENLSVGSFVGRQIRTVGGIHRENARRAHHSIKPFEPREPECASDHALGRASQSSMLFQQDTPATQKPGRAS